MGWGVIWDIGGWSGIDGCRLIGVRKVGIPRLRYEHATGLKGSVAHSVLLEVGHSLRVRKINEPLPKRPPRNCSVGSLPREMFFYQHLRGLVDELLQAEATAIPSMQSRSRGQLFNGKRAGDLSVCVHQRRCLLGWYARCLAHCYCGFKQYTRSWGIETWNVG